jgi:hypothetical protein
MKRKTVLPWLVLTALLSVPGCAGNRMYAWGNYDETLYAHYKNPQDHEKHLEKLKVLVTEAETTGGGKVPPGLYAEYAFALYEAGRADDAVIYFGKEKEKWPESAVIMDKMTRNVQRQEEIRKGRTTEDTGSAPEPGGRNQ